MFTCRDGKGGELSSQASKMFYNIASRATQSNSVYVSVLQISTVLTDGVSKSLCQNFFLASGH